jgi:IS30 family transposase
VLPRGELRRELLSHLRLHRKNRRPRSRGIDRRGQIPEMISIEERPQGILDLTIPGHWEDDLNLGRHHRSALGTLVERTTLFTVLSKMDDASAEPALSSFSLVLKRIEAQKRLSLTYDQGWELSEYQRLTATTGVKVNFADPHSPWQWGINENTNGLLRQYLPKSCDLSVFSQKELDAIAWKLNTLPCKYLGFKCPAELFTPDAFDFKKHYADLFALGN